jgi:fructose 1,6-bisphosphatase
MYALVYDRARLLNWGIYGALKDLLEDSFSGTWRTGEKSTEIFVNQWIVLMKDCF